MSKYGLLKILSIGDKKHHVIAECDCGKIREYYKYNIYSGHTKSCGCQARELTKIRATTHGKSNGEPLYKVWCNMKRRCNNSAHIYYKDYGGRGIKVCQEWEEDFMNFYNWATSNGYETGLEIDRINNDGNYEPNNCRCATKIVNANNTRTNRFIEFNGENKTLAQWAHQYGIYPQALWTRLNNNWGMIDALTTPVRRRGGRNFYKKRIGKFISHSFGYIN